MSYNDDLYKNLSGTIKPEVRRATVGSCIEILNSTAVSGKNIVLVGWPESQLPPANTVLLPGRPSTTDILRSDPDIVILIDS